LAVLIAASKLDPAGVNIAQRLLEKYGFRETDRLFDGGPVYRRGDVFLVYLKGDTITAHYLTREFDVEAVIFVSRNPARGRSAVGYGGSHYAPKQTKASVELDVAVGHVVPKYAFRDEPDEWLAREPVRRTWGGCEAAVIDWKGTRGKTRKWLLKILEEMDVEVIRV